MCLPPRSTLFPYTTLFRSYQYTVCHGGKSFASIRHEHPARLRYRIALTTSRGARGDRKSTRLNSSHRCISYAVFCLKKKNKYKQEKKETSRHHSQRHKTQS